MNITEAIYKLYLNVVRTVGDTAYDADGNEVAYDIQAVTEQAQKDACKEKAKQLLAKSDWSQMPDVSLVNKDVFASYRLNLRNLVLNPVADPVWEDEPTPVWSK